MFEMYWAYVNKTEFVQFLEELIRTIITESLGHLRIPACDGCIDFSGSWKQMTFREAIIEHCGIDIDLYRTPETLIVATRTAGLSIDFSDAHGMGEHYDRLFKKSARPAMVGPIWLFDYPIELKPLAKVHPQDPTKSASVQLVIQGAEIVNAYYHELIDPLDQRARFTDQQILRDAGSEEAQWMDEDFLRALEQGMPPTSGVGIGIDRLVACITGSSSLKEVILFPTLRPTVQE
jgi:lysyl-tRNA synthetase class 2